MGTTIIIKEGWNCEQLWKGCILTAIAHAIMVAHYPELSHEHSWDGINYNVQDSSGGRGTVTFFANSCAAAFNSQSSVRHKETNVNFFRNAPQEIQELAMNETLQYLLEDVQGVPTPIVTTAFWGDENQLF